jgi:hypothetical protein
LPFFLVVVHGAEAFEERTSKAKKRMVGSATIVGWLSPPIDPSDSEETAGSAACQDQPLATVQAPEPSHIASTH